MCVWWGVGAGGSRSKEAKDALGKRVVCLSIFLLQRASNDHIHLKDGMLLLSL